MPARTLRWFMAVLAASLFAAVASAPVLADDPAPVNPVELDIPALGVRANVQDVGLADDGDSIGVPVGFDDVAWYTLGVAPGDTGNAIFTGHVSSTAAPGVFYGISRLRPSNTIRVFGDDGTELIFIVQEIDAFKAEDVPMDRILDSTDQPGLVLITCGGDWDPYAHRFADRIVVFATLAAEQ